MRQTESLRRFLIAIALAMALLAWPAASRAQTVTGQATAAQATVIGPLGTTTTSTISDTGTLGGTNDARDASLLTALPAAALRISTTLQLTGRRSP